MATQASTLVLLFTEHGMKVVNYKYLANKGFIGATFRCSIIFECK